MVKSDDMEILKRIASSVDRNDGYGWYDTSRLDEIRKILKGSPFGEIYTGKNVSIFGQRTLKELSDRDMANIPVICISSHADVVAGISDDGAFSAYDGENGILIGTYDNAATNAACVILMKDYPLPENVIFCFTADEETGRCNGAGEVIDVLDHVKKMYFPVALDVTYENSEYCLYSFENPIMSAPDLDMMTKKLIGMDKGSDFFTGRCVKAEGWQEFKSIPEKYISHGYSMFDEGAYYGEHVPAFSFCLPIVGGEMHSSRGCRMFEAVYEGYIRSLYMLICSMTDPPADMPAGIRDERRSYAVKVHDHYVSHVNYPAP